ncbi:MAG: hypothetical protein DMG93_01960 [Acidobacteria bacterium]|nr:MAG: hypothetical protein DMG93_01960 [Acidobacteriota bacterium]
MSPESKKFSSPDEPLQDQPGTQPTLDCTEDEALAALQRTDIGATEIASLAKRPAAAKSRKVALAVVLHRRAPRHISIPLLRRMFTFELMQVSLTPAVAADIKRAAEDQIIVRAESISTGEKISLAKRSSGRVAAALLQEDDERVISPALDNARLTEALIVQALMKARAPGTLFRLVSGRRKWATRREVQIALLRSEKTPLDQARELANNFSEEFLREIVPEKRFKDLLTAGESERISYQRKRQERAGHDF